MNDALIARWCFRGGRRRRTWRKLSAMMRHGHGASLQYALTIMRDRMKKRGSLLARVFTRILDGMDRGQSLDVAVHGLIPEEEVMLLRGGHKSARHGEAMDLCAELIEAKQRIVSCVVSAFAYPVLLLGLFIGLLLVLSLYIMPELSRMSSPESWTGAGAVLYTVTLFVSSPAGIGVFTGLLALIILMFLSLPRWTGPQRLRMEWLPPWSCYRLVVGSVWLFTVATLMRSNLPLYQILTDMLHSDILRPWLRERVAVFRDECAKGKNLGEILADTGMHFPDDDMIEDLLVYASLPEFGDQLYSLAHEFLDEGVARIEMQARILNLVAILLIAGLVAGLALAVSSIQRQIGSTLGGF